jgi:L-lactate utilization protein LutB
MNYATLSPRARVDETIAELSQRGVQARLVQTKTEALAAVKQLIPAKSSVMTGGSRTLQEIGFTDYLQDGDHPWKNWKEKINQTDVELCRKRYRRESSLSDFYVGSINAIAASGQLVWASASGSQLGAYAYTSPNCIWVAGIQKIVPTLDDALSRVYDFVVPTYVEKSGFDTDEETAMGKLLIFEREKFSDRNLNLILVGEQLGW